MAQNKKTVAELKNELYIATLIEKHQNDNFWLTSISKNEFDSMKSSAMKYAQKTGNTKVASNVIERHVPILKETDLLLYLLLKYSISNVETSKLNDQELSCAKEIILEEFEINTEQFSIDDVAERLKEKFSSPVFINEKIKDIIVDICKDGVRCFEPFSHLLDHSEQFVSTLEYAAVFKCLYSIILTDSEKEEVKSKFNLEYVSAEGKSWEEQMAALKQHHEDEKKAADAYIIQNKIHIVDGIEKGISAIPNIWQYANQEKYSSVLLSFLTGRNSTIDVSPNMFFQFDAIRDHVDKNGYIVVLWEKNFIDTIRPVSTVIADKLIEFKNSLERHSELDAFIPDNGLWEMDAYILKKGKIDKDVHVFYNIDSMKQTDYLHYGNNFLQCRIMTQQDLAAIGYDLSKVNMLPTIHANDGESFHPLSDLMEASKDEYVRLKQTAFGKVFTSDNYASSFETFVVSPSSLREAQVDDKWKKVLEPVLVIRENPFSVAYVEASADQPVFFNEMAMTFFVKKDVVDPKYLYLLSTNGKLEQVVKDCPEGYFEFNEFELYKDEQNRSHVGYWPAMSLLNYKGLIAIPLLPKQRELCEIVEKAERNRLERAAMSQYRQDIHERKHALGQIMTQMRSNWNSLLLSKSEHNGWLDDSFVYGKKHPHTVKQIFETVDSFMKELDEGIENFTPEDRGDFLTKEKIALLDYLEEYVSNHSNPCFELLVDSSSKTETNGLIYFSKKALDTILQNLIFNAWKHGFKGRESGNLIRFILQEDSNSVQLLVSNNGLPLESNMENGTLFKYGKTSARGQESIDGHHHHGLGCYQIWCLMREKGQGDVECISTPNKEFPVTFKLSFYK